MKKIITLIFSLFLLPAFASASVYEEGKHYIVVSEKATAKPELREYFSFYCPACRGFEPLLAEFEKLMPEGATLEKTHVDFMGHTSPEIQYMLSKALIVAEKTGVAKKFSSNIFNHIQTKRGKIDNQDDVRDIYVASGGDAAKFDKGMKNFTVVSQAKKNKKVQTKLSAKRALKSVPTFVVNGKYLINVKALDRQNYIQDYKNLIAYLFTK